MSGPLSHPERLWARHWLRAAGWLLAVTLALGASGELAGDGDGVLSIVALVCAVPCLGLAWRELGLSRRAQIGARSERIVRGALAPLAPHGWEVRHSVGWPDRKWGGDIDHVAVEPDTAIAFAFAVETKTRSYTFADLERTRACAKWVGRRWRSPGGAYGVLCVTRGPSRCDVEEGVIVCSVDRLADALASTAAGGAPQTRRGPASVLAFIGRWIGA